MSSGTYSPVEVRFCYEDESLKIMPSEKSSVQTDHEVPTDGLLWSRVEDGRNNEVDMFYQNANPFAKRDGKTLSWTGVNMVLSASADSAERKLLHEVWGEVPQKQTTAIMGPSGAGKSSLLNVLAGRTRTGRNLSVQADVRLDKVRIDPSDRNFHRIVAFVAQDDSLQITATPREAIRFSAKLRLPRSTTEEQLDELTGRMLGELGLQACADTIVGGPLLKGISGGERKRTSVGVELVTKPTMIFLDEPTSGLDSFSAVQVCDVLNKVAKAGASVLFTIHQPSSEIFASFDYLILLNKGRVMYQGPTAGVPGFFSARGHPCPQNYNPADWIIHVAQATPLKDLKRMRYFPKDKRGLEQTVYLPMTDTLYLTNFEEPSPGKRTQIKLLITRELAHMGRDKSAVAARMVNTLVLSSLVGFIFLNVGRTSSASNVNLQSHFGAIMIVFLFAMLGSAQPALLAFPDERPVFLREYSTNHYTVLSYFVSRLVLEAIVTGVQMTLLLGITYNMIGFQGSYGVLFADLYVLAMTSTAIAVLIGCISGGNTKVAIQMLPMMFVPQMLFAGFFVAPSLIPAWLRWVQYIMPMTYGIRIALVEEFFHCSDQSEEELNCLVLLWNVQADPNSTGWYWAVMFIQFVVLRLTALRLLQKKATRFYS